MSRRTRCLVLALLALVAACGINLSSVQAEPAQLESNSIATPLQADVEIPQDVKTQLERIKGRVTELKAEGRDSAADELANRFAELWASIQGRAPISTSDEVELHVVGVYEGKSDSDKTASVNVEYNEKPIILAICAYEPVWWTIDAAPGVKITKIILGGHHHQEIEKLPSGIEVERHVHDDRDENAFQAFSLDDDSYVEAVSILKRLTGKSPSTLVGAYRAGATPIVVGERNPDWKWQRLRPAVSALYDVATAEERQRIAGELVQITFPAIYTDMQYRGRDTTAVAMFKVWGPLPDTLKPTRSLTQLTIDPHTSRAYGVSMHELFEVDLSTGKAKELKLANQKDLPRFSWTAGVAFDTKRRRLLVMTSHVFCRLYAYEVDADRWSLLSTSRGGFYGSMAYHAKDDVIYMTGRDGGTGSCASLHKFTPDGDSLGEIELSETIRTSLHSLGRTQLIQLNDDLFVIIPRPREVPGADGPTFEVPAYVVNRHTGKIVYTCTQSKDPE